jgi:hypothetical protein
LNYSDRQFEYSDLNEARILPLSIKISEQNVQEGTLEIISILEKEKQAAKEIFNQTEKLAYLEFIDREIEHHNVLLNLPSVVSQAAQSNETQPIGESTQIEKINWKGSEAQLVFLIGLLIKPDAWLEDYGKWKMVEKHFMVQGKSLSAKQLEQTSTNILDNKNEIPRKGNNLKKIVSQVSNLDN